MAAGMAKPRLSIVMPVLNEAPVLERALAALQPWRRAAELIVADGGSADGSARMIDGRCDEWITARGGRAAQMNSGAGLAKGEVLMFLHCDTELKAAPDAFVAALPPPPFWGFFRARLSGADWRFRVIEWMMNLRARLTGIATGDHCLVVSRDLWRECGGFAAMPLMEDVEICRRLRRRMPPTIFTAPPVITSSRRWERDGVFATVWLMWRLRWAYWRGADPAQLHRVYYGK